MQNKLRNMIQGWRGLVHTHELVAVALSFAWFFLVMFSYQLLRPIRESLASELTSVQKSNLFLYTFLAMLLAVPVYGRLVAMFKRKTLMLLLFGAFALCAVLFSVWNQAVSSNKLSVSSSLSFQRPENRPANYTAEKTSADQQQNPIPGERHSEAEATNVPRVRMIKVFFVWVSVFSLYATSLVWSVLIDIFTNEQGKRLFGIIASGATTGAISASTLAISAKQIGNSRIIMLSAAVLGLSCLFGLGLDYAVRKWPANLRDVKVEPGMFSGIKEIAKSAYLTQMILYIGLISLFGSLIYMRLTEAAKLEIVEAEQRTAYFAKLNLYVQLGTLCVQALVVGPIMRTVGLSISLMTLPLVAAICFSIMSWRADLLVLGIVDVVSRITTYGFSVPSREVLFTVVSREEKFKAKNVVDTLVIRGSDSLSSTAYALLTKLASYSTLCLCILPLIGLWSVLAFALARMQAKLAYQQQLQQQ